MIRYKSIDGMCEDEELVRSYLAGDATAFEKLFERHRHAVFQFVLRMLGNRAVAEEVFQEVFLRVHGKIKLYQEKQRFAAWLFAIAKNVCLDTLRKQKRERWLQLGKSLPPFLSENDPEKEVSREQALERIMQAVRTLEIRQKQIFLLRIHGNLSP